MTSYGLRLYVKRHEKYLAAFLAGLRKRELDFSEDVIAAARRSGNVRINLTFLERFGCDRGWGPRVDLKGKVAHDHQHAVTLADLDRFSTEQLRHMLASERAKVVDAQPAA